MRGRQAAGICLAAVMAGAAPAAAGGLPAARSTPDTLRLLDVPYVPQSAQLCGGAALAMVLRFWGERGVLAEDYAGLVDPGANGIRTGTLVQAIEVSGWTVLPVSGTSTGVERQIALGRPIIALLRTGENSYHYVVLLACVEAWVVLHDPSVGPFRAVPRAEFETTWAGSDNWAIVVLPPQGSRELDARDFAGVGPPSQATPAGGATMIDAGILMARDGNAAGAERQFQAAQSLYPRWAAPLREQAGSRFRTEDWAGASTLAEKALALDPGDTYSWRLLAGSRFLAGDVEGALTAWNRLSEPRVDLTRIRGLNRIRYAAVAGQLGLPPGRLLTPQALRQANRRLAELPAQSDHRLSLRPLPDGSAQVDVALLERAQPFAGPWDIGSLGLQALTEHEIALDVVSPTGNGELWSAAWRWQKDRPQLRLGLTVPAPGGRPGIWRVSGLRERQTYAAGIVSGSRGAGSSILIREERRRAAVSHADWLGAGLRLRMGAALDAWAGRGPHLSLEVAVETRWARDHLALGGRGERWISLAGGRPFGAGGLSLTWCSDSLDRREAWKIDLGVSSTTSEAPLALWSGAGTGHGRAPFLRAHPLLNGGVIEGDVFGRSLAHGTIEGLAWSRQLGPVRLGWALFVDGARVWDSGAGPVPWQMDGGSGIRLEGVGMSGRLRIDAAHGLLDGNSAFSVGWTIP